ncbi:MAG: amino acid adenylation domain-containing protein [Nannocystaceae bacterium]
MYAPTGAEPAGAEAPSAGDLVALLEARARQWPDKVIYRFLESGESTGPITRETYGGLRRLAVRIAARLAAAAAPGDRALLIYPPGLDFVRAFFGCLYAGVVAVPAYPPEPGGLARTLARLRAVIDDAGASLVLTTAALARAARGPAAEAGLAELRWIVTDDLGGGSGEGSEERSEERSEEGSEEGSEEAPEGAPLAPPRIPGGDAIAFIQYTSGSTGRPKGVVVRHSNLLHNTGLIADGFELTPASVCVSWLPLFHDMGLIGPVLTTLRAGGECVLMSPLAFLQRPIRWMQAVSRFRAQWTGGPNFAFDLCARKASDAEVAALDLRGLTSLFNGAEPVRVPTLEGFVDRFAAAGLRRDALQPTYGLAEATLMVTLTRPRAGARWRAFGGDPAALVACGVGPVDQQIEIVDPESRRALPDGEVGELWVAGPSVAAGYWRRPEESAAIFGARIAGSEGGPYLRTGDLAIRWEGELYLRGRLKDVILLHGKNLHPHDVEVVVEAAHPGIRPGCSAAIGVDAEGEERLIVVAEVKPEGIEALRRIAGDVRAAVAVELGIEVHGVALLPPRTIPKTSSGKIRRRACAKGWVEGTLGALCELRGAELLEDAGVRARERPADAGAPVLGGVDQDVRRSEVEAAAGTEGQGERAADRRAPLDRQAILEWLAAWVAGRVGLSIDRVAIDAPLVRYGLDSAALVALSGELADRVGRSLPPTIAYTHPTLAALATAVCGGGTPRSLAPRAQVAAGEAIAIVGVGLRLPGGVVDLDGLWALLAEGRATARPIGSERWAPSTNAATSAASASPTTATSPEPALGGRSASLLDGSIDAFDPEFFGVAPREAPFVDPQHRLLLEVAWEALEDAEIVPARLQRSRSGVFVGLEPGEYGRRLVDATEPHAATGLSPSFAAGRLAYTLGLRGPALGVSTACSSSLVALHVACKALARGECDLALAAGVQLLVAEEPFTILDRLGALAADGRCRTFSADAGGYGRGEGAVVLVLQRLADAVAADRRILAVICGSAVGHDGASNGIAAPSGDAQEEVVRAALADADLDPQEIDLVECHGTGTRLGDPIEVAALASVFGDRPADRPLLLGAVKPNLGHLEAAAGLAGVVKVVAALREGAIPPTILSRPRSPHIPWDAIPLRVVDAVTPWPRGALRRAGVSSFGLSGTNAHVILEGPPRAAEGGDRGGGRGSGVAARGVASNAGPVPLLVSGRTRAALHAQGAALREWMEEHPEASVAEVARAQATTRSRFEHRAVIVARGRDDALSGLASLAGAPAGRIAIGEARVTGKVAFVFPGQGGQWVGMARALLEGSEPFAEAVHAVDRALMPHLGASLLGALRGDPDAPPLRTSDVVQPALFAVTIGLAEVWRSLSVVPHAVVGHSQGEVAAACIAGALDLADAARIVARRGRALRALAGAGGMIAVALPIAELTPRLARFGDRVTIAADNGPTSTAVSGEPAALEALLEGLAAEGVQARRIPVDYASHHPQVDALQGALTAALSGIRPRAPSLPIYTSAGEHEGAPAFDGAYWFRNLRAPVRFRQAIARLIADGHRFFVEVSPHPILAGSIEAALDEAGVRGAVVGSLRRDDGGIERVLQGLGELIVRGHDVDLGAILPAARRVSLPRYAFQRARHWIDARPSGSATAPVHPVAALPSIEYRMRWRRVAGEGATIDGAWLIVGRETQGEAILTLAEAIAARGGMARALFFGAGDDVGAGIAAAQEVGPLRGVVSLLSLGTGERRDDEGAVAGGGAGPSDDMSLQTGYSGEGPGMTAAIEPTLAVIAALHGAATPLWICTRGAVSVGPEDLLTAPLAAIHWGLGRALALEAPARWGGLVDLTDESSLAAEAIARSIVDALAGDEDQLAIRADGLHAPRLASIPATLCNERFRARGTVLITGGTGALGLRVARWFAERGAARVVLASRRGRAAPGAEACLAGLAAAGVDAAIVRCDVGDRDAVAALLDRLRAGGPPLRAVVHAAGVAVDGPIEGIGGREWTSVLRAKVAGALHLDALLGDAPLDAFVLFSSLAGALGGARQGAYGGANAALDALAERRRGRGLAATSIAWGAWEGGGMVDAAREAALARVGVLPLAPEQALGAMERALLRGDAAAIVGRIEWSRYLPAVSFARRRPLFDDLSRALAGASTEPLSEARDRPLGALPVVARGARIRALVAGAAAATLGLGGADGLAGDRSLTSCGLDSLMAMELRNRIEAATGVRLAASALLGGPTIDRLVAAVMTGAAGSSSDAAATGSIADASASREPSTSTSSAEVGPAAALSMPTAPTTRSNVGDAIADAVATRSPTPERPRGPRMPRLLPASPGQRRLWLLDRILRRPEAYHVHLRVRVATRLDPAILEVALAHLVDRHDQLRTGLVSRDDALVQRVVPWCEVPLTVADDLRDDPGEGSALRFDLARPPLLRVALTYDGDSSVLAFTWHHAITDGWSLRVFARDLAEAYDAIAADRPPADRAVASAAEGVARAALDHEALRAWWRDELVDLEPLALPVDRPAPAEPTEVGGLQAIDLGPEIVAAVESAARRCGTTPFVVLLTAFAALLRRLSGQEDLAIGTALSGRDGPGLDDAIGFFVNNLPVRCRLRGDASLTEAIAAVRDRVLAVADHQALPLDEVVAAVAPRRGQERTGSPLFRVHFTLDEARWFPEGLAGAPVERLGESVGGDLPGTAKFDLELALARRGDRYVGAMIYAADLFDAATIERWAGHLRVLLGALSSAGSIDELPILAEAEREALLRLSAGPIVGGPRRSVVEQIASQVEARPRALAVVDEARALDYAAFASEVDALARRLRAAGIGAGARVPILIERSIALVVAIHAVTAVGAAYVPIDVELPEARITELLAEVAADVHLLGGGSKSPPLPEGARSIEVTLTGEATPTGPIEGDARVEARPGAREAWTTPAVDDPAYVIFTSGSTGRPKGVVNLHAGLENRLAWMQARTPIGPGDRVLHKTPIGFDVSVWELYWPLMCGATLVVARPGVHRDSAALAALVQRAGVTVIHFVPPMLQAFLEEPEASGCVGLRHVFASGEALSFELAERARAALPARLHNLYGPTEAAIDVSAFEVGPPRADRRIPIGGPVANTRLLVLDPRGEPAPIGVPGELFLGGVQVAQGYLHDPERTAASFVADPFVAGGRLYRTGDRARWLADGELEFLGRVDFQVKIRGQRIEPAEIERALLEEPGVREALVIARDDRGGERRLLAYVGADPTFDVTRAREALVRRLPAAMVPTALVRLDHLPRSKHGKIDRAALPIPEASLARPVAPRGPVEELVMGIFAELLGVPSIGGDVDFFDAGGHSLLATRVVSRIRAALGVDLPLAALFEARSAAGLARVIAASTGAAPALSPPIVPVPRDASIPTSFPASPAQEGLWFLDRLDPGSPAYVIPATLRLEGEVDPIALDSALRGLVRRHEPLRTVFAEEDGRLVQRISPAGPLRESVDEGAPSILAQIDLRGLAAGARAEALAEAIDADARAPFDLERGPLLRARLVRLGDTEHALLLALHHIACDGWSLGILLRELGELYAAARARRPARLDPLPFHYADVAAAERRRQGDDASTRSLDHWRSRLAGAPPALDLPTDRPRPSRRSSRGSSVPVLLPAALSERLRGLARAEGVTLFMLLLAGFAALLARHSGQTDLVIGAPVAGRTRAEVEGLCGLFVNTLALRIDLAAEPTLRELLARVRRTTLDAYAHQELPFERLVDALGIPRDLARAPLVQAVFALQEPLPLPVLPGVAIRREPFEARAAKFDLCLALEGGPGAITGVLEYSEDLFERATIAAMVEQLVTLLEGMCAAPTTLVSRLPLHSAKSRVRRIAAGSPRTRHPEATLVARFEAQVDRTPGSIAIEHGGERLTYRELDARANQLAHHLVGLGVGREDRVGLAFDRAPEAVVAVLAALKAGAAYVPLDPEYPAERSAFVLEDVAARVVVTAGGIAARLPRGAAIGHGPSEGRGSDPAIEAEGDPTAVGGAQLVDLDRDRERVAAAPRDRLARGPAPADAAYVIHTSGSTGRPKGVVVEHRQVARLFDATRGRLGFGEGDVWTLFHSLAFDFSVWELFGALLHGGRLVIVPRAVARSAIALRRLLADARVTVLSQTPSAFQALSRADEAADAGGPLALRLVVFGGEALDFASLRPWVDRHGDAAPRLCNMYGITETTVHVTARLVTRADVDAPRGSLLGAPLEDMALHVLDASGEPAAIGVPGEIHVGGAGVARGYLNRPELSAERFVADPFGPGRLYRSGDLGRVLADGEIVYLGRADRQVKIAGFRIEPGEIEAALRALPGITAAAVIAREDTPGARRLCAYVVAEGAIAGGVDVSGLRERLGASLPAHMIPAAIVEVPALPRTESGKLDVRALPAPGRERPALRQAYAPPTSAAERILVEIFAEVLGLDRVGVDDNYFELGGDSLRSVRVAALARARGLVGSIEALFERPTVRALARVAAPAEAVGCADPGARTLPVHGGAASDEGEPTDGEDAAMHDRGATDDEGAATRDAGTTSERPFALVDDVIRARLPADVVDAYPLTALQAGMVFHHDFAPGDGLYHDVFLFHLELAFDAAAFASALAELAARQPILRTSFDLGAPGGPIQRVHRAASIPLDVQDLRGLDRGAQEAAIDAWRSAERARGFEWARPPLLRMAVLRRSEATVELGVSLSHAILDGWSVAAMLVEWVERALGRPLPPAPATSFRRFVALERASVEDPADRRFFAEFLAGAPRGVLPRSRGPRPAEGLRRVCPAIDPAVSKRLSEVARAARIPLKSLLLAAHVRVLAAYFGDDDVTTGLVAHGRVDEEGGDRTLGLHLNTLPFRQRIDAASSWIELARESLAIERELLPHRRLPLREIQAIADAARVAAVFNFTHFHVYDGLRAAGGARILGVRAVERTNFELAANFGIAPEGGALHLEIAVTSPEIGDADLERIAGAYGRVLAAIAADPGASPIDAPVLGDDERARILAASRGAPAIDRPLAPAWFEAQAARSPDAIAIEDDAESWTYAELRLRADALARRLIALGVRAGDRIAVRIERSPALIAALLGVLQAGAVWVPIDPAIPAGREARVLADAAPRVLLVRGGDSVVREVEVHRVDAAKEREVVEREVEVALEVVDVDAPAPLAIAEVDLPTIAPTDLAYVLYTSGSTGAPRGVAVPHGALANLIAAQGAAFEVSASDRVLQFASVGFDVFVSEVFAALAVGATLVLAPAASRIPGAPLHQLLARQQVSVAMFAASTLAATPAEGLPALRLVISGGEPCTPAIVARWAPGRALLNVYGPTEATVAATVSGPLAPSSEGRPPPIGRPLAGVSARVLDARGAPAPIGVAGELHLGGAQLALGYLGRPEATAERFVADPSAPGARLLRSGDRARLCADGQLELLGRIDRQLKVRGHRIEPAEIEAALLAQPGVEAAAIRPAPDGEALHAYVSPASASPEALAAALARDLPEFMRPSAIVALDALPTTAHGKVDLGALPAPATVTIERPVEAPRGAREAQIAAIWADVLGRAVGRDDRFFTVGGHSLAAARVVRGVGEALGVELPIRVIYEADTIAALSARIRSLCPQSVQSMESTDSVERLECADFIDGLECADPLDGAALERVDPTDRDHRDHRDHGYELVDPAGGALSFAEERLWFLDRLSPGSAAYTMIAALRLAGPLDPAALQRSLGALVRRHEGLRTIFPGIDGRPVRRRLEGATLPLPVEDLGAIEPERRVEAARLRAAEEAARPFDLAAGPLVRARLLRLERDEHVLVLVLHHIVGDAASIGILLRELAELYAAEVDARAPRLAPVGEGPGSYAARERAQAAGGGMEALRRYWTAALAGAPQRLDLPVDRPRPPIKGDRGAVLSVPLAPALVAALDALAREEGATRFMVLLAGFALLLARESGQHDLVVGSPFADRGRPELAGTVGLLLRTFALRLDLSGAPTGRALIGRVREATLGAHSHADFPLDRLVDALRVDREPSRTPLFQVMFVQSPPRGGGGPRADAPAFPGIEAAPFAVPQRTSPFDLTLSIEGEDEALTAHFEYDAALFEAATIDRFAAELKALLAGLARRPDAAVDALPRLSEAELRALAAAERARAAENCDDAPRSTVVARLLEQVARTPDAPAVEAGGAVISYAELERRARALAHALRGRGVEVGERVAILCPRAPSLAIAILGVLLARVTYVPLDPSWPAERVRLLVRDAGCRVLLDGAGVRGVDTSSLDLGERVVEGGGERPDDRASTGLGDLERVTIDAAAEIVEPPPLVDAPTPGDVAYVLYTSGSTGRPKGVVVDHAAVDNHAVAMARRFRLAPGERVLQFASPAFDAAVEELFPTWIAGATLIFRPEGALDSSAAFTRALAEASIDVVNLPTAFWHVWAEGLGDGALPPSLRLVVIGGEAARPAVVARWRARRGPTLLNTYGPTEATVTATDHLLVGRLGDELASDDDAAPIGRPIANVSAYVLDASRRPVPPGVAGELYLGGVGVARGYLGRPELDAARFLADPFRPGGRMLRTGDLVRRRADGALLFLGRADDQIKIRGHRVEVGEIEAALVALPGVRHAVVVPREVGPGDRRLVACLVAETSPPPAVGELRAALAARLPAFMIPSAFALLDRLPLTDRGKLDRRRLAMAALHALEDGALEPSTLEPSTLEPSPSAAPRTSLRAGTEAQLAAIWRDVLGVGAIGPRSHFFEGGGDSLRVIQVVDRARRARIPLTPRQLFLHPVLAELAAAIDAAKDESPTNLVPLRGGPHGPTAFLVHPYGGGIAEYRDLAPLLRVPTRIFAIRATGLEPGEAPRASLADIAGAYAEQVLAAADPSAIHLVGYSLGGVFAFETACAMERLGQPPRSLTLIDGVARPPAGHAVAEDPLREVLADTLEVSIEALRGRDPGSIFAAHEARLGALFSDAAAFARWFATARAMESIALGAPLGTYHGPVTLVRASASGLVSADYGWAPHVRGGLDEQVAPGTHASVVLGANATRLAGIVDGILRARAGEARPTPRAGAGSVRPRGSE